MFYDVTQEFNQLNNVVELSQLLLCVVELRVVRVRISVTFESRYNTK